MPNLEAIILKIIAAQPLGIERDEIEARLRARKVQRASPATVRRYLSQLVDTGRITREGESVARIYKIAPASAPTSATVAGPVPLTADAVQVQALVSRPLAARKPVPYQPQFLTEYQPNQFIYLSETQIRRLHDLGRSNMEERPAGTYARDILGRLLIDLSWASSRLEGNTYTLLDTKRLIEEGVAAAGKNAKEAQMILNHKRAIELLVDDAEHIGFNAFTLRNLHATLAEGLMADPAAEGRLRMRVVEIEGSVYHPPPVPQQIEQYFQEALDKAVAINDPFEQAFFAMVHIPYLQPFEDVNKRVSRLAANIPLIRDNLCPLSFIDVPNDLYVEGLLGVYELNRYELLRDVFMWAYERSCQLYPIKKAEVAQPDPLRIKYRELLHQLLRMLVRGELAPTSDAVLAEVRAAGVEPDESEALTRMTLQDLARMNEGNFARYGIRPLEFAQWQNTRR